VGDEDDEAPRGSPPVPMAPVHGDLTADGVLVADEAEASTLRNKGAYGETLPQGRLRLSFLEAAYLVEAGRLLLSRRGAPVSFRDLARLAHRGDAEFEITYVVYRDLRSRGYVVEQGTAPIDFRVHPRGGRPGKTQTKTWVSALSERDPFRLADLLDRVRHVQGLRRQLLVGVVDEESDLTYYAAREVQPSGTVRVGKAQASADLFADRALVAEEDQARALSEAGHFGKFLGARLQLSLLETAYLMAHGALEVRSARSERPVPKEEVVRRARRRQADFDLRLRVYADLRERGILVKTGYKYGTHFRAYEGDPERVHAKYLVHALPAGHRGGWPEVSRGVRLAHGVKKQLLLASVGEAIAYLDLSRVRP